MEWSQIREHYLTIFQEKALTQQAVARAGGLHAQTAISKMLDNEKRGPSVETFVRAVLGLGMTMTAFFAALEQETPPAQLPSLVDRLTHLEQVFQAYAGITAQTESSITVDSLVGRSPHVESSSSGPGSMQHTTIGVGVHEFEAIVHKQFDLFKRDVERLTTRLARDLAKDRPAHRGASGLRPPARPRHRKRAG